MTSDERKTLLMRQALHFLMAATKEAKPSQLVQEHYAYFVRAIEIACTPEYDTQEKIRKATMDLSKQYANAADLIVAYNGLTAAGAASITQATTVPAWYICTTMGYWKQALGTCTQSDGGVAIDGVARRPGHCGDRSHTGKSG